MMIQTKAFFGDGHYRPIDEQVNAFIKENQNIKVIDVKLTDCENTSSTQAYLVALLIYETDNPDLLP
jgi:hypothetical protein